MCSWTARAKAFLISEDGPTSVEYALMLALILMVALGAVTALGEKVSGVFAGLNGMLEVPS